MEMKFFAFLSLFVSLVFTQDSPNVYWNSLATDVTVGVPLVDDATLIGGRIQIKVSFNGGKSYENMGEIFTIEKSDIDDLKNDVNDLRNFSLQLLANTALADSRSELNSFKNETKKELDEFKIFTSKEIEEIKQLSKEILDIYKKNPVKSDNILSKELKDLSKEMKKNSTGSSAIDESYLEEIVETYQDLAEKIENNSVQNDLKEIKNELANLSSSSTTKSTIDPAVMEKLQSAPSSGASDNAAGLSELKYYIVELMKDQNEIRQIVKDLREILEKNEEN